MSSMFFWRFTISFSLSFRMTMVPWISVLALFSSFWSSDFNSSSNLSRHHSLAKLLRDHNTIPISDYQKQPSFLTDIKLFCADHNQRYQHYCVTHECPICYRCIKIHRECSDVIPIDEVVDKAHGKSLQRAALFRPSPTIYTFQVPVKRRCPGFSHWSFNSTYFFSCIVVLVVVHNMH
jgi:hypothetical protein